MQFECQDFFVGGKRGAANTRKPEGWRALRLRVLLRFDLAYLDRRRLTNAAAPADRTSTSVPGSGASGGVEAFSCVVTPVGDRSEGGGVGFDIWSLCSSITWLLVASGLGAGRPDEALHSGAEERTRNATDARAGITVRIRGSRERYVVGSLRFLRTMNSQ